MTAAKPPPKAAGVKVTLVDETGAETGEILSAAELADVRAFLALQRRAKDPLDLEQLAADQPHIHEIVDGKKASILIWKWIGAAAKWIGVVIAAWFAIKSFLATGGAPKP